MLGSQQDTGSIMTRSRSDQGQITVVDWMPLPSSEFGTVVPDPLHPTGPWLKVTETALTVPPHNPIGVATVWYVQQGLDSIHIRCFLPEAET